MTKSRFLAVFMMLVLALTSLSVPVFAQHDYAVVLSTMEDPIDDTPQYLDVEIASFASGCGDEEFLTMAAIDTDGNLWMWGDNSYGKCLSDGDILDTPTKVMEGVKQVAIGENHVAVIRTNNTLWTWGRNHEGQLGIGSVEDREVPKQILSNIKSVVAGPDSTLALNESSDLYAFGINQHSQFTYNSTNAWITYRLTTPTVVSSNVVDMAIGNTWSVIVKKDGKVYGSGNNGNGQLGAGPFIPGEGDDNFSGGYLNVEDRNQVVIDFSKESTKAVKVSTGNDYTMIVTEDGRLWGTGKSFYGQMGDNIIGTNLVTYIMDGVKDVYCGDKCSIVLTTDGKLVQLGGPDKGFINETNAGSTELKTGISQISNTGIPMALDTTGSLYVIEDKISSAVDIKVPVEKVTEIRYIFQTGGRITAYVGGDKEINGGVFLIGFYKDDVLKGAIKQEVSATGDAVTFTPPDDSDRCRIFLFNNLTNIVPLADDKGFGLTGSLDIAATATAVTAPGYDTTYNVTVEVNTNAQEYANTPVTLAVIPDSAEDEDALRDAAYIYQGYMDANGNTTITFPMHIECAGYKACVNAGGVYLGETHIIED